MTIGGMVSTTFPMTLPSQAEPVSIRASNKDPMTRQIPAYTSSSVPPLSSHPDPTPIGEEYQPQVEDTVPPVGMGHMLEERNCCFYRHD